jgi:hypothetical protein
MAAKKYKYIAMKTAVAVGGIVLGNCTQAQLREMYEHGDIRFIEKEEIQSKKPDKETEKDAE